MTVAARHAGAAACHNFSLACRLCSTLTPREPSMTLILFTRNHADHSTDKGYQFEFFCDRCGNGFMSEFQASAIGMAGSALRTVGNIFGGFLGSVGGSTYEME